MNLEPLYADLAESGQAEWADRLRAQSEGWLVGHGDFARWSSALDALPALQSIEARFDLPAVTVDARCEDPSRLRNSLQALTPWRKGPFSIAGVEIDSEWRSNLKWQRVEPELAPLEGRRVLDVGCGNGYYGWRMLAQSPARIVGVEPSVLFNMQFLALQKYLQREDIQLLPIGVEQLPPDLEWFDTVLSMGVLYHRRSPLEHLLQLKSLLRPGGELCLETLVIEGEAGRILLPRDRYARMRNVWFIPSARELVAWLERCGFSGVRIVDETLTTSEEQRSTDWMRFESLADCLTPGDPMLTVEGYPAPRRAVLLANRPTA